MCLALYSGSIQRDPAQAMEQIATDIRMGLRLFPGHAMEIALNNTTALHPVRAALRKEFKEEWADFLWTDLRRGARREEIATRVANAKRFLL